MTEQEEKIENTSWLEKLALESWQGEMIISGAAIFGSFQLPGALRAIVHFALTTFNEEVLNVLYFVFFYLSLAISVLIASFVIHFILRAIWIGTVGLWSVFPEGINMKSDKYSASYLRQAVEDFGNLNGFVKRLDQVCSIVFAFAFSIVMNFISLSLLLAGFILFAFVLNNLFPQIPFSTAAYGLILLLLPPVALSAAMNTKALRDKKWVEKIHYPFFQKRFARIIFNIFYEPLYYINFVFMTNLSRYRFPTIIIFSIVFVMPIASYILQDSKLLFLRQEIYFLVGDSEKRLYNQHYEDQLEPNQVLLMPLIPHDRVPKEALKVFIPLPEREYSFIRKKWGVYKDNKQLSEYENDEKRRAFDLANIKRYLSIQLNDHPLSNLTYRFAHYPITNDNGIITYIPSDNLQLGDNVLRIVCNYYLFEGRKKQNIIPFWCDPAKE
jgi:hypothetical protein